ncbi:MAG TPA: helix-turn-helix transcriptional regulator, partial [Kineosporiaceae bacterium]|nr:helix-turn-helix transcriptional regulator [Kineosporiaceae bacterium]
RWRQADLAERLGWSLTKVGDVESGRRRITVDQLVELCRALEVPMMRLLDGSDVADLDTLGLPGDPPGNAGVTRQLPPTPNNHR